MRIVFTDTLDPLLTETRDKWEELQARLEKAATTIKGMAEEVLADTSRDDQQGAVRYQRLTGKYDGVRLALSYMYEMEHS